MHVNWWGDITYFTSVDSNLVSKHAWSRYFNWIRPVVVVVAKSISKVQNGILRDLRWVFSNVEMSWLYSTLGYWMWYKEKVEFSINNLRLLYETLINISSLRWVHNSIMLNLEESLSYSLIYNNQGYFWEWLSWTARVWILISHNFL